jgi:hypothetical protein
MPAQRGIILQRVLGIGNRGSGTEVVNSLDQISQGKEAIRPATKHRFHDGPITSSWPVVVELSAVRHNPLNRLTLLRKS